STPRRARPSRRGAPPDRRCAPPRRPRGASRETRRAAPPRLESVRHPPRPWPRRALPPGSVPGNLPHVLFYEGVLPSPRRDTRERFDMSGAAKGMAGLVAALALIGGLAFWML